MNLRRTISMALAVSIIPVMTAAVTASPAAATGNPSIVVTTTSDVIDGGDGLTSLREAVDLADATAGDDTIQLADGATYDLTLCGSEASPYNSIGDLDATGTDALTIEGPAAATAAPTIHQTCTQRVIEQGTASLTLSHLAVVGGSSGSGAGFSVASNGPLTLDHVDLSGASGSSGASFTDAAVVAKGRPISIVDSRIHANTTTGVFVGGTGAFADAVIERTSVDHNDNTAASSGAGGIESTAPVTIDGSTVSDNKGRDGGGMALWPGQITDTEITRNTAAHGAGGLFGQFSLTDSELTDNTAPFGAGGQGIFAVVRSTVADNVSTGLLGGGLAGIGSVTDSTISGNTTAGVGGGIFAEPMNPGSGPVSALTITNSTITGNQGHVAGGIMAIDDWIDTHSNTPPANVTTPIAVTIASSTIAGNTVVAPSVPDATVPSVSELAFARANGEPATNLVGSLTATSSVLGSGLSATPVCSLAATSSVTSGGYNFSADNSCVGAGTGNIVAGGEAHLGLLQNNGGPTETMMPGAGSPLINQIPSGAAGCGSSPDQRGQARPVGVKCDIGSVESPVLPPNSPIVVNLATDTIDAGDGKTSLREAITKANNQPGDDTIQLAGGATYDLTICGDISDHTDNAIGDLNVTGTDKLTITGPTGAAAVAPIIHQTCDRRLIQSGAPLTLSHLVLLGGVFPQGTAVTADAALTLDHVDQSGAAGVAGLPVDLHSSAILANAKPVLITDSVIHDNTVAGVELEGVGTPANTTIERSTVRDNVATDSPDAAGIASRLQGLTLDQSLVTGNTGGYLAGGLTGVGVVITSSTISNNSGFHAGGVQGGFTLTDSVLSGNTTSSGNGGGEGRFTVLRSTISGNHGHLLAGGLYGDGSITDSTITGNDGLAGGLVASSYSDGTIGLTITNTTVTGNTGILAGGLVAIDSWANGGSTPVVPVPVTINSSTIAGNFHTPFTGGAPDFVPAQGVDIAFVRVNGEPTTNVVGSLSVSGSVIGSIAPGSTPTDPICDLGAASPVESGGSNFSADSSCVQEGPGDIVDGGDAQLGALADNGGSTETMVPAVGSALIDQVPVGTLECGTTDDQRGVARPIGPRCDIGAVEAPPVTFHAVDPVRIKDTRPAPQRVGSGGPWGAGETQTVAVTGGISGVPASAAAVVLNVTVLNASVAGDYLSVWPAGAAQPTVSSLNVSPGEVHSNQVTVKVGAADSIAVFNAAGSADVLVDVNGYYDTDSGDGYTSLSPVRVIDSRPAPNRVGPLSAWGPGVVQDVSVTGGTTGVPADADAVVMNVTATGGTANGDYLSVWPSGTTMPTVSSINMNAAQTVASQVTVKVGSGGSHAGKISVFNAGGTQQVLIDIVGYFKAGTGKAFHPLVPSRLIDSRPPPSRVGPLGGWGPGVSQAVDATASGLVPDEAASVITNITATGGSVNGDYLTVWPTGVTRPTASSLNVDAGKTVANAVTTRLGSGASAGQLSVFNAGGAIHVIIDISGYYA